MSGCQVTNLDPDETNLADWNDAGLLKPSVVKPVISSFDVRLVRRKLGALSAADRARVRSAFASILEMFQQCELVAERFIERGDSVVVPTIWRGTLHDSESVIEQHVVAVYTFRGQQVIHIDYCEHLEEAFERIGDLES